jgi:hypothetical protein
LQFILQLRHVMDPKRHFKRAGKSKALPKYFQVSNLIHSHSGWHTHHVYLPSLLKTLCIIFCNWCTEFLHVGFRSVQLLSLHLSSTLVEWQGGSVKQLWLMSCYQMNILRATGMLIMQTYLWIGTGLFFQCNFFSLNCIWLFRFLEIHEIEL